MARGRGNDTRARMAAAWYGAAFQRSKRMPPLRRVIGDGERAPQSSGEIVAALKAKFGAKNG